MTVDVIEQQEELGGKPNKGTPADGRLRRNKNKNASTPNSEAEVSVADDVEVETLATDNQVETPMWQGVLVPEGVTTGDGREFADGSIKWAEMPMPLRWQKESAHGGMNDVTVNVGSITRVWRDGNNIMGEGTIDLGGPEDDDSHEIFRRLSNENSSSSGVSIDADDITDADIEYVFPKPDDSKESDDEEDDDNWLMMLFAMPEKIIFHSARIRAATLVDIPAFTEAKIHLLSDSEKSSYAESIETFSQENQALGAIGTHSTATSDGSWDGPANEARLNSPMPLATVKKAYAWYDATQTDDNGEYAKSACKFIHHEVSSDGTPGAANLTACSTGIGVLHGGRGGTTIPSGDKRGVYDHLAKHLRDGGQEPPPFQIEDGLVAHAWHDVYKPPSEWFSNPNLGQVMPIIVTDNGRVYGHAAQWGDCHLGYMNECVMPPHEDYHSHYMTGEIICDDGKHFAVGQITAGLKHAPLTMSAGKAAEHYEDTSAVVADVVVGNDKYGIWVAGSIRPTADASRVQALRASGQVSPDWRRIGGSLRMVALLTVTVSGYQVPRARSFVASGNIQSLVSSGMVSVRQQGPTEEELNKRALKLLRDNLTRRVHPEGND